MKKLFGLIIIGLLLISHPVDAQSISGAGMTYKKSQVTVDQFFETTVCLNDDPGTDTSTYNDADEATDLAGTVNVTNYNKEVSVEWHVPVLGSTGIDLTFHGRFGTDTGWALLATEEIRSTTGTSTHGTITIQEKPKYFKVGRIATGTDGVDDISIWIRGTGWAR